MVTISDNKNINYPELLKRPIENTFEGRSVVQEMIKQVKVQDDSALQLLTNRFDGIDIDRFELDNQTIVILVVAIRLMKIFKVQLK